MMALGVSGAAIRRRSAIGQFMHLMRRNSADDLHHRGQRCRLPRASFSTADIGSTLRQRDQRTAAIDTCALAIQLGATFGSLVLRRQEATAANAEGGDCAQGTVMLDVISLCVTFNDHEARQELQVFAGERRAINEIGFVASFDDIEVDYDSARYTTCRCTTDPVAPAQAA